MKIIYIAVVAMPSAYASSVHIANMIDKIGEIGHDVVLFNPNILRSTDSNKLANYYRVNRNFKLSRPVFPRRNWSRLALLYHLQNVARKISDWIQLQVLAPDLIYIRDQALSEFAEVVVNLNKPFILEAHLPNKNSYLDMLLSSKNLVKFVVISQSLKLEYLRLYPNVAHKIEVHHDAANMNSITIVDESTDIYPKHIGTSVNLFVGGYIGNLYPGKCMEELVSFAPLLSDHVKFVVFGGSPVDIDRWAVYLRDNMILNIELKGYLPQSDLLGQLHAIDFFIAPFSQVVTQGTGIDLTPWMSPLKIFEYMSLKRPIVCSDLPVIREVLVNGRNSLLCQPGNPESWAKAIMLLRHNRELASSLAKNAYEDFSKYYTWAERARRIVGSSAQ